MDRKKEIEKIEKIRKLVSDAALEIYKKSGELDSAMVVRDLFTLVLSFSVFVCPEKAHFESVMKRFIVRVKDPEFYDHVETFADKNY